ncbi:hypothetical protein Kpol_1028p63 [Vanderwaltozyma polyspora DSM 70294]|uniref:1,3-beta-glucanosyltransferase n=1 Tax=Vanderwaltozyma polyspora (strain ATCC 22028 / DSM 70294 / BCRC 21397 / CBS 2163 / NBRC 10782 / NRRL Y-8283 / UCD 57-17) TaxID=436907 RepID=A7TG31_VANPO|nr:uncharacterized protein Kpol_1028p63 [Vanderwaltozyma polyspora DSM 70294]EDO18788.1 hypothetical protein Kpol_1028p63 [Vanderwaltozyma polyspora DSM 70294]
MLFNKVTSFALASLLAGYATAADLPAIEVVGNKFFYSNNGSQFYMKGIAYQADTANVTSGSSINDPLADFASCSRDIPYLQQLSTNVIRVYAVNTTMDHSQCMDALVDAGIYVIADLSEPDASINRDSPEWTVELFDRYKSVVDMFANYTNVLGFFAGNEVTNNSTNTPASAFVKAAVRDTKAYIKEKNYRSIPVGYSSNDDADTRVAIADYFACGDSDERADFYGINMYEWCGNQNFQSSGYADRTKDFQNLTVPIFFSEYGCNLVQPRQFTEVQALYGANMTDVWSGGIVYMYFEETNNYGLVSIVNDKVSTLADFNNYSKQIHSISPSSANTASYTPTSTSMACPATGRYWKAATALPPTPNSGLCSCMDAANSCVVADDVDSKDYQELFNYICGEISCDGISSNGTTGKYGAYSFCSDKEKLNFVLNLYYQNNGAVSSACAFSGSASVKSATTLSVCSSALEAVGSVGTNIYTSDISMASGSSTSSSSSAKNSSKSSSRSNSSGSSSSSSSSSATSTKSSKNAAGSSFKVNMAQVMLSSFATFAVAAGLGFALA